MKRLILVATLVLAPAAAIASGGGFPVPWTIDPYGGPPAEQDAFYDGHPGILLAKAPWARLFAAWRMLHGLPVGAEAGKTLAEPCCGSGWGGADAGIKAWTQARTAVPDAPKIDDTSIDPYRTVGDFAAVQTCFNEAFRTAATTLQARIAAHGVADPWVKAWVLAQDAVFAGCNGSDGLPPLATGAPDWLRADYAYQQAALALYQRHFKAAEDQFLAIAADTASPWSPYGPYLAARAAVTAALPTDDKVAFAHARTLLAALDPPDVFGHAGQARLLGALAFRDQPDERRKALAAELAGPALPPTVAADFKDSRRLGQSPAGEPAYLDWIAVFGRTPDKPEAQWFDHFQADQVWKTDADALAHARQRWKDTGDVAWLLAAMIWSGPGDDAADLVAAARKIAPDQPAYLTALYHRVRLAGPKPDDQADLDAALARTDLALSDRNLLLAERVLALSDLGDLARLGPRTSPCVTPDDTDKGCLVTDYGMEDLPFSTLRPDLRFGDDAAAILDQLPIAERAKLAGNAALPPGLGFDLAFTTWVRAVLTGDDATADRLTPRLKAGLPQLTKEWDTYLAARPGNDKRFAAWFILAKVPGADVDLRGPYTRPQGAVADFDGHWRNWLYAPAGAKSVGPAAIDGDIVCYGLCGQGAFPVAMPAPVAAMADRAAAERGRFMPADAAKAGSVWEDVLAYVKAHAADPRSPEALYWVVRVSRFGTGHNRSSYRAFMLLHERYKNSSWAKETKYFYD
ncbi:MAG TPA: hypothetical protein VHB27_05110 [Rhodopila sp.]|uniref:hypothetical protein n=1 Tax=Rhodopila sp. TaxID=2480087 RepID=UPI002D0F5BB8|nr:hypothetical protein [Rhodopila sp.]HVY14583.1 hypothetical protein [Rhodopila sp.]